MVFLSTSASEGPGAIAPSTRARVRAAQISRVIDGRLFWECVFSHVVNEFRLVVSNLSEILLHSR